MLVDFYWRYPHTVDNLAVMRILILNLCYYAYMGLSKWFNVKEEVIAKRKQGYSLRYFAREYGIANSTLSYWFKDIELSTDAKNKMKLRAAPHLSRARAKSAVWHNNEKQIRILTAKNEALEVQTQIPKSLEVLELALAMLYFGEGAKEHKTSLGSSDPFMLSFFISGLEKVYGIKRNELKYELHLRDDHNEKQMIRFWSDKLQIDPTRITYVVKDPRTVNKPTRLGYPGVCQVQAGRIAIQRRLIALYNIYCTEVIKGD